jgi:lipoprotein-anchoring transpeptidase ErfK/SrfK
MKSTITAMNGTMRRCRIRFFTDTGDAMHGTCEQRNLGHAVSHGGVRLRRHTVGTGKAEKDG